MTKAREKKIPNKSFLRNVRESLGIKTRWKMAQRLEMKFGAYNAAEVSGGLPSKQVIKRLVAEFGWERVGALIQAELENP